MTEPTVPSSSSRAGAAARHPRGLSTLFFTEMWERFSYYGMRALLVLFLVDATRGGMGLTDEVATAIYGFYTAAVYLMALPGGWLADRVLGAQRAVWYGGVVIALGHFMLAIPRHETFYLGLALVAIGSGILKPNMSALVGELYPEGGSRRDAGFTIFYMGVNLGAFMGPVTCSLLGEKLNWHYGFCAAGVGMVFGLIQFRLSRRLLGMAGVRHGNEEPLRVVERFGLMVGLAVAVVVVGLAVGGLLESKAVAIARGMTTVIVAIAALYFAGIFLFGRLDPGEKRRVRMLLVLFLSSALFWSGFEQAGSSFNLFAERYTTRRLAWFGAEIPAGWFQALGPIFIILFAPVFASLWVRLARRNLDPSTPVKFALGLILLAAGFGVMAGAAGVVASGHQAAPAWLLMTYLMHSFGELCLSPVGLSSVTKLAPRRYAGQMMGVWFLATSLGNLLAGLLAGGFKPEALKDWPWLYLRITILPIAAALLLILLARRIKSLLASRP